MCRVGDVNIFGCSSFSHFFLLPLLSIQLPCIYTFSYTYTHIYINCTIQSAYEGTERKNREWDIKRNHFTFASYFICSTLVLNLQTYLCVHGKLSILINYAQSVN